MQTKAGKIGYGTLLVFAVLFPLISLVRYLFLDPTMLVEAGFKMYDFHDSLWTTVLYTHITTAAAAFFIGPFNFMKSSYTKNIKRHRMLGKVYFAAIVVSSLCGFYLAVYAHGGLLAKAGFFMLSVLWLYTTVKAVNLARQKKIQDHRQWMVRSYAVTFAALTFRVWLSALAMFGNFDLAYGLAAWLCWAVNLIVVEVWLWRNNSRKPLIQAKNAL
ncbi:hypothetical protein CBW65_19590 [Tumebacillus avium]|uniref:DUF2306 domain-containing protein n=1 Tax=Tumebacillus avium TaxID=1903704 RepID=A0A1Y0IQS2_9BACL|nr:DUF2306 domain-containing protein [Tumebacillus avium]ARU62938.1 hypothetical protein CBW65_19590 [Tumebacillus avium]